MLVLVIGDLHIPDKAADLPAKFKRLLVPGKIQQIICTGNVCDKETHEYLRSIAPEIHVVRGDYDENIHYPLSHTLPHPPSLRIGVIGGQQVIPPADHHSLASLARQMDVDVLVSGGTHRFESFESEGRFFINPGSATGAWTGMDGGGGDPIVPSFALMDIQGPQVVTYVYSLVDGDVKVEKVEYRKSIEEPRGGVGGGLVRGGAVDVPVGGGGGGGGNW